MKLEATLAVSLFVALLSGSAARAEEHHETRREMQHEEHHEARRETQYEGHPPPAPRPAPPRFQPHPPGVHPHGPIVRPHPIRVMRPHITKYGVHPWRHWNHPEFARPIYYWDWAAVRQVTCIAEDSYGDQYPLTEETFAGFGLTNMSTVEDDALDRCNAESGGDASCFLVSCSHF